MTARNSQKRIHDMGGQSGDPIVIEPPHSPVFAENWHAHALAITIAAGGLGKWTLDESRHARERLPAEDYMTYSYYEKWLAGLTTLLVEHDLVQPEELAQGKAQQNTNQTEAKAASPEQIHRAIHYGASSVRPDCKAPRFCCGQSVRTHNPDSAALIPGGHTRLPGYVAGRTGVIIRHHRSHVLPDSNAHKLGEQPEHLYGVMFRAAALWPDTMHPNDEICLDLWESYLMEAKGS